MTGIIILWYGPIADVPLGWQLCDGTNGTPDLRNRFLIGSGGAFTPGSSGGQRQHNHTYIGSIHLHLIQGGIVVGGGFAVQDKTDFRAIPGTTDRTSSEPPYYALAWIQKMAA